MEAERHTLRSSFAEAMTDLKARGVRLTPQRQMILRYLKETHAHPTAEQIYKHVCEQFEGISMATVYNTLHRLKELGVIRELSYGDESSRYDGNDTEHAHLHCTSCAEVLDVPLPSPAQLALTGVEGAGYQIHSYRLEYYGVCAACQQEAAAAKPN